MARYPRFDAPGTRHHVFNRGARKDDVFIDDECRRVFLSILGELPERDGTEVHGWSLMPNHYHLILTAGREGLGPSLKYLQSQYGRWFNSRKSWDGPLWRSRYSSRPVDSDDYWRHLLAYLHLNPVADGFAGQPGELGWTSHRAYVGAEPRPAWLTVGEHLELYGSVEAYLEYLAEIDAGVDVVPAGFDPDRLWRRPRRVQPRAVERPVVETPPDVWPMSSEAAFVALALVTGRSQAELMSQSKGKHGALGWWLTLWWLPRARGVPASQVAEELGVHPATVTRSRQKLRQRAAEDPKLRRWMERLDGLLPAAAKVG